MFCSSNKVNGDGSDSCVYPFWVQNNSGLPKTSPQIVLCVGNLDSALVRSIEASKTVKTAVRFLTKLYILT